MKIIIAKNSIKHPVIALHDFSRIYREFHKKDEDETDISTVDLERKGMKLLEKGLNNTTDVSEFIHDVFTWAGTTSCRVKGQLKEHDEEKIAKFVRESGEYLRERDVKSAITKIISLKGLCVSYGSKILRMLAPQQVGVYDDRLAKFYSYSIDPIGFVEFCNDCQTVVDALKEIKHEHPYCSSYRKPNEWFIADVEAVLFHRIREEEEKKKAVNRN